MGAFSCRCQPLAAAGLCAMLTLLAGCGGSEQRWPSTAEDFVRVAADRGLARVWGVSVDVEKTGGATAEAVESGTFGAEPESAAGSVELRLGTVTLKLATTGSESFNLEVNGKPLGQVRAGNRIRITADREVYVNDKLRS